MFNDCTPAAPFRRPPTRAIAALLITTVIVGCTAPGTAPGVSRYEPTYLRLTEERAFAQALRRHYLELATNAFDRGDVARSDFYSLRALMAAEGKLAQPGRVTAQSDPGGEAAAAGERLSMLLMTGARVGSPDIAARAQAAYDCWLVEAGPSGDPQIAASCRFNALNALAQLEGASTGAALVNAGGPRDPEGQTYVIESGAPSRVVTAHGVTIEVITEQDGYAAPQTYAAPQGYVEQTYAAPQTFVQEPSYVPAPATYTAIEQPAPSYVVETVPIMEAAPEPYAMSPEFDTLQVISADEIMMIEEVGAPTNIIPMPMQATMFQEPTIDLGPVETIPVYGTAPVPAMPMVEMTALPTAQDEAVAALMEAAMDRGGDFSVFFGFDSDAVTIEAEDTLIDAIEQIKLSGARQVTLMGYTDSVGDSRYNQLLAMRRAQSVRKFLQGALGNTVGYDILPVGEIQAVRNGGDGVKEALNRKVDISIR